MQILLNTLQLRATALILLCGSVMLSSSLPARADFQIVGDISIDGIGAPLTPAQIAAFNDGDGLPGTGDTEGGTVNGFIIGDTATGGLLADGAAPFLGSLEALQSDSAIIGNAEGSIGAANIEDFFFGADGNWDITNDLVVGHAGVGYLDLLNAAGIGSAPSTSVGGTIYVGGGTGSTHPTAALSGDSGALGQGIVRVNGLGSRLQSSSTGDSLIVGGEGVGVVEASGRSSIGTLGISEIGSTGDTGDGTVRLTDLGTRWTASDDVNIGGEAGLSHGKVQIQNEAVLQLGDSDPTATPNPTLTINERGRIELTNGTLRMLPQAGTPLTNPIINDGVILGDGFIDGGILISATGELRNAADLANQREYLLVSEAVISSGLIESEGGEMEFEQRVTSTGTVFGRDAILRFRGSEAGTSASPDLAVNAGTLQVGGDTTIHGDVNIDIAAGASLVAFGGGAVVFVDNLTFNAAPPAFPLSGLSASSTQAESTAPATFNVTLGDTPALHIGGALDLSSGLTLDVTYDGSEPSMENDVLTVLTALGGITGTFANTEVIADGRVWDIDYLTDPLSSLVTEVFITAGAIFTGLEGDFDNDGDVDGSDFLYWQRNLGDPASLAAWQSNYGPQPVAQVSAVPEPTSLVLALLTVVCCPRRTRG